VTQQAMKVAIQFRSTVFFKPTKISIVLILFEHKINANWIFVSRALKHWLSFRCVALFNCWSIMEQSKT